MSAVATKEVELNFGDNLPAGLQSFSLDFLRRHLGCSLQHVHGLYKKGAFGKAVVDLRTPGASAAMIRVSRPGVISFLENRQDWEAVAESNPSPAPRPWTKRKRNQKGGRK